MALYELRSQDDVFRLPLPRQKSEVAYFDKGKAGKRAKGLALRVRPDGSRTWVYFYRLNGRLRKLAIGPATQDRSGWTIDKARSEAHALRVKVDKGVDPSEAKQNAKAATAESKTFRETMDAYLEARRKNMKPRSYQETKRHLEKHWKPLHRLAIHTIDADRIADRLKEIEKESGPATRNRTRSSLSAMFAWAVGERITKQLRSNPVAGTIKAEESRSRDRILSDDELVAIWKAAPANGYGRIVRLLMLTAQRREEIGGLRWSEVMALDDPDKAQLLLPAQRTKNSRAHEVPLSSLAIDVLNEHHRDADRDLVFGEGEGGYSGWSRSKGGLDDAAGVKDWTLHDLRRTAATRMADLGIQPHIIEAVLNHVSGHKSGVAGIYNRSSYAKERREALNIWANHIRMLLARAQGANVTKFKRA
jgi:integrase